MSYKNLISDLKSRLEAVDRYDTDDDARKAILRAFWSAGRDVYEYTRKTGEPIKNIALDAGEPRGSLEKFVRFYKYFPNGYKEEIDGRPLSWSHYAALLYRGSKKAREFYLRNTAIHNWSSHELRRRIRNNYYENRQDEPTQKKEKGAQLKASRQRLYTYSAKVLKVVDADTFFLDIDVGFNARMKHKARLRGINCPEKGTKKGEKAKEFVEKELMRCALESPLHPLVVIRSYKAGKFGRYIMDLWYLSGETDKERILEEGKLLNQVLLDKGLARKIE